MTEFCERTAHPPSTARKKVLIVDDSAVMRSWLRTVLASDARLEIVGEAGDAGEVARVRAYCTYRQ